MQVVANLDVASLFNPAADVLVFVIVDFLFNEMAGLGAIFFLLYMKYILSITQYRLCKHECYTDGMALFIRQNDERTELQKRIATELQGKAKKRIELADSPDLVEDSEYIKGSKKTTSLAWVWLLIIIAFVGIAIWLMATGLAR